MSLRFCVLFLAALLISILQTAGTPAPTPPRETPQDLFLRAARDGDTEAMRQLLDRHPAEIDLNFSDDSTRPPLHEALRFRRTDAALFLLDAGAEAGLEHKERYRAATDALSPLALAVIGDDRQVLKRLLDQGQRPQLTFPQVHPTILAMENDHIECLDLLIEYGVDPLEVAYQRGNRTEPIHMRAAFVGAHRVLRRLIEAGADPNHTSKNGLTPLHLAASSRSLETVDVLLEAGAEINARFRWGASYPEVTPLMRAVDAGDLKIVERLLEAGADVSIDHHRALYCADLLADRTIYEQLLQAGARKESYQFAPDKKKVLFKNVEVGVTDTLEKALEALAVSNLQTTREPSDAAKNPDEARQTMAVFFDEDSANWANLILTHITGIGSPELVERRRLDAIQAEAGLRSSALSSGALTQALALTPAEYALVISGNRRDGDGSLVAVEARLVEIDSGVIARTWLLSTTEAKTTPDATQLVAESIAALVGDKSHIDHSTLAVLNRFPVSEARTATHPAANDFNLLLEQGLGSRKDIRLLDRRSLDRVLSEQALAGSSGEKILRGGWFIEGGISLGDNEQMTVTAQLTDGAGRTLSHRIGPATAEQAAEDTATWILSQTGTLEAASFDHSEEANRLIRLAEWSIQTEQFEEGIRLADAAWALDPDRWQTRMIRLNARRAFVESRVGALSRARGKAGGKRLIGVRLDEGFFGALDPLEWYDLGVDPEGLLLRLQESYLLMRSLASEHPALVRRQQQALRLTYNSMGAAFSWFAPIHQQERHAAAYRATKRAAQQATEGLIAVFDGATAGTNEFLLDSRFLRQWPYFYEPAQLEDLLHRAIRESAEAIKSRQTSAQFGSHTNWRLFRAGNTSYHARPIYPLSFWRSMANELRTNPDWASRLMGLMVARATGPEAMARPLNEAMIEVLKAVPPNPKLRLLPQSLHDSTAFKGSSLSLVEMREIRDWAKENSVIYLNTRDLGTIPGYSADYLDQARLMQDVIDGKRKSSDFHSSFVATQNAVAAVDQFMDAMRKLNKETDGDDFIAPTRVFHPFAYDSRLKARYSAFWRQNMPLIITDHALWVVYKMRPASGRGDFPAACVYRFDRQTDQISELILPGAFARNGYPRNARLGIAESKTHVLVSASRGGAIGIFDKNSGEWEILDGYTGAGLADAFAVKDGFIFIAGIGAPERGPRGIPLHRHTLVLHYHTETKEIRRLADNRKVPADYPFEDPGVAFTELRLSPDRQSFNLRGDVINPRDGWGQRKYNGSVHIADGTWSDQTFPVKLDWQLQRGATHYYLSKKSNAAFDGNSFFLRKKGPGNKNLEIPVDQRAVQAAIEALNLPPDHALSKSETTGNKVRNLIIYDDTVAVIESTLIRFYNVSDILRALSDSQQKENR